MRRSKHYPLEGGLNEVTPPLSLKGGELYGCSNYEPGPKGGYSRIDGFERLDGRPAPSDASYWILNFDAGNVVAPAIGAIANGATSGASGIVGTVVLESGAWDGTGAGYLVLYEVSGGFIDNESISFTAALDAFDTGFSSGFG